MFHDKDECTLVIYITHTIRVRGDIFMQGRKVIAVTFSLLGKGNIDMDIDLKNDIPCHKIDIFCTGDGGLSPPHTCHLYTNTVSIIWQILPLPDV